MCVCVGDVWCEIVFTGTLYLLCYVIRALYIMWYGVNRLGDSGVNRLGDTSAFVNTAGDS